jgi:hypothetical protein
VRGEFRAGLSLPVAILLCGRAAAETRPAYLPPAPQQRASPATSYELRRDAAGWSFQARGFVAHVAEDGGVRYEERHGEMHLALPLPMATPPGTPTLEGSLRGLVDRRARPRLPPAAEPPGTLPHISPYRPDPTAWCRYPDPCFFVASVTLIDVAGTFDLTDEILRLRHQDPYRQQKARFLASTAAFRQELGRRAARRARAEALEALRVRLDAIDRDGRGGPDERRAALEALAADLDRDPVVAGPAQALIEARLHQLSPDAGVR